ncbi:testis-expressed protein 51 [Eubalaena glacialis]|uniref:testis-expressed protein 51 n=1 Tax=Eubalaena glacialis TaxID=27606 RepID=UPI002A5B0304|nr:testis-expressed protein 51 [Eubalaena glacialis]
MLLLLLSCLLPTANGKSCLQCWPELPALIDYDLQILWGIPGPPAELSHSLHSLFLDSHAFLESWYLGQDHLEEAAGTLFTHIDKAIKKFRDDKPSLLEEVDVLKQQFSKHLEDLSEELKEKDIRSTLEVINCANCKTHFLTCQDASLCPGTRRNFVWAVSLSIALPLATLAGDVTFSGSRRRKRRRRRRQKRRSWGIQNSHGGEAVSAWGQQGRRWITGAADDGIYRLCLRENVALSCSIPLQIPFLLSPQGCRVKWNPRDPQPTEILLGPIAQLLKQGFLSPLALPVLPPWSWWPGWKQADFSITI